MKRALFWLTGLIAIAVAVQAQPSTVQVDAVWNGDIRWLTGVDWGLENPIAGGDAFDDQSIGIGRNFYGSSVTDEQHVPVILRISASDTTLAGRIDYRTFRTADSVGVFPGSAWDYSDPDNPRRLNICFMEDDRIATPNRLWDPSDAGIGNREIILIMRSSYDSLGTSYLGQRFRADASSLDVMYVYWPRRVGGQLPFASDPVTINILPIEMRLTGYGTDGGAVIEWSTTSALDDVDWYEVERETAPGTWERVDSTGATTRSSFIDGLTNREPVVFRVVAWQTGVIINRTLPLSLTPNEFGLTLRLLDRWDGAGLYNGIWGYTDSSTGREYAIICVPFDGAKVIDITDSAEFVSTLPATNLQEVKIYQTFAFLCNENGGPIHVYDLADPANPSLATTIPVGAHTHNIYENYLFLNGTGRSGVDIYDISIPSNPVLISSVGSWYYHDTEIKNDTLVGFGIFGNGIEFVDISDIANPVILGGFNYPGSGAHNGQFTTDMQYLIVGDEIGSGTWTRVFDVSDINNAELVSEIIVDSNAVAHNCYLKDNFLYLAHYTEGVRVWDMTNPEQPYELTAFDTYLPNDFGFNGVWTVYPFFASGKIIASDRQSGLWVFELTDVPTNANEPEPPNTALPETFRLDQNFPNPFNPSTTISFVLSERGLATVEIFDILGRQVRTLVTGRFPAGTHAVEWDGRNGEGNAVASGVYFYRLTVNGERATRKMMLIK